MPLQPEHNPNYWPLLLTDDLYLLPEELKKMQQQLPVAPAQNHQQATAPAPQSGKAEGAAAATQTPAHASEQEQAKPDLLWGSLQRGVLILVNYPEHPLIDRPDGLFLVEVLKAVGYDFKEVATLNISRCTTAADWAYIKGLSYQYALVFGVQTPQLPFTQNAPLYQQTEADGKQVLMAETLQQIRSDVGSKKKLWNLLKQALV